MDKRVKHVSIAAIILLGIVTLAYGLMVYRSSQFDKIAASYLKDKYGINAVAIGSYKPQMRPLTEWSKDILLESNTNPDLKIWVRLNWDGSVYSDNYYHYILEKKLSEKYGELFRQIWNNVDDVTVETGGIYEHFELLGGKNLIAMNAALNDELLKIMDKEAENVNIEDIRELLPGHYTAFNIYYNSGKVDVDSEAVKVLEMINKLESNGLAPSVYINYYYNDDIIKSATVSDWLDITTVEKAKECFQEPYGYE